MGYNYKGYDMSLHFGPEAFEAISRLKNNSDWRAFVAALQTQLSAFMHLAMDGPVEKRVDATGYVRALRDVVECIELNEKPQGPRSRPVVRARESVNA